MALHLKPANLLVGDEHVDVAIEWTYGDGRCHLLFKGQGTSDALELGVGEVAIIEPTSPAQAVAKLVETEPRNQNQVNHRGGERDSGYRFTNPHLGYREIVGEGANLDGHHAPLRPTDLGCENPLAILPGTKHDGGGIYLVRKRKKDHDHFGLDVLGLLEEPMTRS